MWQTYYRFGKDPFIPATPHPLPALKICEEDVQQLLNRHKMKKAPGLDSGSTSCLRVYAVELVPIFTRIFS